MCIRDSCGAIGVFFVCLSGYEPIYIDRVLPTDIKCRFSLVSPAPMAMNACRYAKEGSFPVGVHWTLFSEWKEECWMPADKEKRDSSLTVNGLLPADGGAAAKRAVSGLSLIHI